MFNNEFSRFGLLKIFIIIIIIISIDEGCTCFDSKYVPRAFAWQICLNNIPGIMYNVTIYSEIHMDF